ncbi:MAG: hypothetical protein ACFWUE_02030 [Xylanivirga thermophila]|jgi:hypothetical protein
MPSTERDDHRVEIILERVYIESAPGSCIFEFLVGYAVYAALMLRGE